MTVPDRGSSNRLRARLKLKLLRHQDYAKSTESNWDPSSESSMGSVWKWDNPRRRFRMRRNPTFGVSFDNA